MRSVVTALLMLLPLTAVGQPAPATQEFGPWRLVCTTDRMTDRGTCRLRHRDWVEPPDGANPGLGLEVLDRGGRLVAAIVARDLTLESTRGLMALLGTAQLRFPPNRLFEMPCGLEGRSLVCAPRPGDLERAAAELAGADRVLLRVVGFGIGLPDAEPRELPLADTRAALDRFRATADPATSPREGLSGRELLQRLQQLLN